MDPTQLRNILAVLKEAGVRKASIPVIDDSCMAARQLPLEVEFEPAPAKPPAPLIDPTTGQPVNLDEGAPEMAQADLDDKIRAANFPAPGPKHARPKPPEPGKKA